MQDTYVTCIYSLQKHYPLIVDKTDFGIRGVVLRLLHKLLPKLVREQLSEIAQILSVDGPNECQTWTLEIYKWNYDYITLIAKLLNLKY
ncbi:unnamed protein product [Rotaria magnacalcarata]|uniref:Uncharacterized protein n=1 Tax=Rotaria magnacalcarata TaxID=392030 RepID=A0A816KAL9_9BILA|nr:unnamed protein product [Rotaria magnacalcarata]CAF3884035.1 unnamed protein product [Rotaria magnacalcarata]CAF3949983.1 unnamed protein product [Rotaria magnacalcarata]CAF3975870.1 unnamed protein product [Rotaria magnacalcarata]CAF4028769.1 unnamed protein product [Rotaria magnacalcarata]